MASYGRYPHNLARTCFDTLINDVEMTENIMPKFHNVHDSWRKDIHTVESDNIHNFYSIIKEKNSWLEQQGFGCEETESGTD